MSHMSLLIRRYREVILLSGQLICAAISLYISATRHPTLPQWFDKSPWAAFLSWQLTFYVWYLCCNICNRIFLGKLRPFEKKQVRRAKLSQFLGTLILVATTAGLDITEAFCWLLWTTPFNFTRIGVAAIHERLSNSLGNGVEVESEPNRRADAFDNTPERLSESFGVAADQAATSSSLVSAENDEMTLLKAPELTTTSASIVDSNSDENFGSEEAVELERSGCIDTSKEKGPSRCMKSAKSIGVSCCSKSSSEVPKEVNSSLDVSASEKFPVFSLVLRWPLVIKAKKLLVDVGHDFRNTAANLKRKWLLITYMWLLLAASAVWAAAGYCVFKDLPSMTTKFFVAYDPAVLFLRWFAVMINLLGASNDFTFICSWTIDFICLLLASARFLTGWTMASRVWLVNVADILVFIRLRTFVAALTKEIYQLTLFIALRKILPRNSSVIHLRPPFPLCVICRDSMQTARCLNECGHLMHQSCLLRWLESNMSCPICRAACLTPGDTK